jgi:hypothetical protein
VNAMVQDPYCRAVLEAALALAGEGIAVFPLKYAAKEPEARSRGFYDATTNPATIRRWFGGKFKRNLGARTGQASGVWVLDEDELGALAALAEKHGPLPATRESSTGRGRHLWFKTTPLPIPSRQGKGRIWPGTDIKAEGGYVVAPPSIHPDGPVYRWVNDAPIVEAPSWLLALARKSKPTEPTEPTPRSNAARPSSGRPGAYAAAALEREIAILANTPKGGRNHQANASSFSLHQLVAGGELKGDDVTDALIKACEKKRPSRGGWAAIGVGHNPVGRSCRYAPSALSTGGRGMIEDRQYQTDVIAEFHRTTAQFKRIILVAPTGSGKTVIASAIIKDYVKRHKTVLVLCDRGEIVNQTVAKLREFGMWCGIIWAEAGRMDVQQLAPVQVASIQTLHARAIRSTRLELPQADLVVVDEAQHIKARTWQEIVNSYPNAILLGLTATPCRGDGRGLGGTFQIMIQCPQVAELIKLGHLVPGRVYAPATPDLKGVKITAGDSNEKQLADRMDKSDLIADIVGSWSKYGKGRKTVCFATSVGHSLHLRDEFLHAGVRAEHIDGHTPKEERDSTLERLKTGEIDVVCNCMVLTEGWDQPEVSCCILARPTKHMGLFRQMTRHPPRRR